MNGRTLLIAAMVVWCGVRSVTAADTVVLRGGKALRGLLLDHRSDELAIKLRTDHGEMPVLRSTVERVELDPDLEARYWLAREYFEETAAGLLDLALWCQANKLEDERDEHLNAVLEIDTNHPEARKLLGYVRRGGEWVVKEAAPDTLDPQTAKQAATAVGAPRPNHDHREKFDQMRRRQEIVRKQQELNKTVVRLASWLDSKNADQVHRAREELAELRDPLAIGPLTQAMANAAEPNRFRLLEAINQIPNPEATYALGIAAVVDLSPEVRELALKMLGSRREQRDHYVPLIELALRSEKVGLNYNAADALVELEEKSSIPGLIDALATPVRTAYITQAPSSVPRSSVPPPGGLSGLPSGPRSRGWEQGVSCVNVWNGNEVPIQCPP